MDQKLKILAIIGARSGSKGVPDKNIRPLAGKPLMYWIIKAALSSKYINRVFLSTDSEEYAKIAKDFGVEVPFLRPAEFAQDSSPDFDYVNYTVNELAKQENYSPDIVTRLFPTVPFQQSVDIDGAIEALLNDSAADSAVVIAQARQHPAKALKIIDDKNGKKYVVTYQEGEGIGVTGLAPRQSYEPAYFRANVIVSRRETLEKYKDVRSLTGDKVAYYIIPQSRLIDIDSELDFEIAEYLMKKYYNL